MNICGGQALGRRASITRALVRSDAFAKCWMFPSAYHIKVIVRDGDTFWLSSGNLNNSNEPDLSRPPHTEDRDWHVIIQDQGLAGIFSEYLNYDYKSAAANQAPNPAANEKAIVDAQAKKGEQANPTPPKPVAPLKSPVAAKTFTNVSVGITPLLTPDTLDAGAGQYLANIVKLINSAEKSIYIQLQYIEASPGKGTVYDNLLQAIKDKVDAGLDVRLIESLDYGPKWVEKMKDAGVNLIDNIRLQPSVHNKGFVIDSKTVVVSSQNFSPQGVQQNRDAGVIIENPAIAQYFEGIFLSDWNNNNKPASAVRAKAPAKKGPAKKLPAKKAPATKAPAKKGHKK
jgi:phosphatidylserine/phosphatidylglycerophosphate/cardiolipin synthase-like enzyme